MKRARRKKKRVRISDIEPAEYPATVLTIHSMAMPGDRIVLGLRGMTREMRDELIADFLEVMPEGYQEEWFTDVKHFKETGDLSFRLGDDDSGESELEEAFGLH